MKRLIIAIFALLPLAATAQTVKELTPEERLEQAQKQLIEAQKAVEAAKANAEKAKAKAKEETERKQAAIEEKIKKANEEAARLNAEAEKLREEAAKAARQQEGTVDYTNKGSWVVPTVPAAEKQVADNKVADTQDLSAYLEGAVSTNDDGKIVFTLDLDIPGKSAQEIYDITFRYLTSLTTDNYQRTDTYKPSAISLVNPTSHVIAARMCEWMVFSESFLSLDRTEFNYMLIATCADNHLHMTMERMNFNYEEQRSTGFKAPAEDIISDKQSLNKTKTRLNKAYGKFRKGTINRKNTLFNGLETALKQ